jgi:hypothetical protein
MKQCQNEFSLQQAWRILSPYTLRNGARIWVIPEAHRSVTAVALWPELLDDALDWHSGDCYFRTVAVTNLPQRHCPVYG